MVETNIPTSKTQKKKGIFSSSAPRMNIISRMYMQANNIQFNSTVIGGAGSLVNLGFLVNSTDPEPRRCRRTDGKKWRCSKDAAPDQKYCERHMHRGKPRSRKPVEAPRSKAPESFSAAAVHSTNSISVAPPVARGGADNLSWNYMGLSDSYGLFGNQEDKSSSQLKQAGSKPRYYIYFGK